MTDVPSPTYDWRDLRYAIAQARPDFEGLSNEEREPLWEFAEAVLANHPRMKSRCIGCKQQFAWEQIYRCFDCHAPLCRDCIKPHCEDTGRQSCASQ